MPYPNAQDLLLWPFQCERLDIHESFSIETTRTENCFLQIVSGKANVRYEGKVYTLAMRSVVVLGRNTTIVLETHEQQCCQLLLLRFHHVPSSPNINLNHLCLNVPLVDSFFGRKTRFCILTDREYIYVTLGAILYEWEHNMPERDALLFSFFNEFFIKLARSFHAHNRPSGIQFLTRARTFMQQNFQSALTVDAIAAHTGISRSYLALLFSRYMQRSVVEYLQAVRCDQAAFLLATTKFTVISIALDTGFTNRQHFTRVFTRLYGMSPSKYRRAHQVTYPGD